MEETSIPGSNDPAKHTTNKLQPDSALYNRSTGATTTPLKAISKTPIQSQDQTTPTVENLQLVVIEGFQVGRGVARMDPADMTKLGCQPGDIIMVTGNRTTAAKVVPSALVDRGQQTIQMDSQVRQNSASGLGERITIHKAKVQNAEKITLLPLGGGTPI